MFTKFKLIFSMKKIIIFLSFIMLPIFAYDVYFPGEYNYKDKGDKLLFVVDFSNSMGEYLEHETKVNQVKDMMRYVLPKISDTTKIGLRVYGHTCNLLAYNACRSSELLVPVEFNSKQAITSEISRLRPRGMTPITYSLKQAIKKDLAGLEGTKHIILLTDGGENCDESPCDYSIELIKTRKDIKIDVIAFNVNDDDDLAQLKCTADVTGGRFSEADTKAELYRSMENMILPHRKQVEAVIFNED